MDISLSAPLFLLLGIGMGRLWATWADNRRAQKALDKLLAEKEQRVVPPKFRIRTGESDPNRRAKVVSARVRAIKYTIPGPRRGRPKN